MSRAKGRLSKERLLKTATYVATDATWVFAIVVAMSLVSSFFSIRYMSGLDDDLGAMYEQDIKGQNYAQNAYATLLEAESTAKDLALAETGAARAAAVASLRSQGASLRSLVLKALPSLDSGKYRTLTARSKADANAFVDALQKGLGASEAPDQEAARALLASIEAPAKALKSDLLKLNDVKRRAGVNAFRAVRLQLRLSLYATIGILAVSIGVRIFLWRGQKKKAGSSERSEEK
jgi:hypothetical protein